jgi:adenine phosphoribosyltransferase
MDDIAALIRDVPDFPKPGIVFKDITPLLADAPAMARTADALAAPWRDAGITRVLGIESRGFIFGSLVAERLACGFAPLRKPGKLPWTTRRRDYTLEYGQAALEIHDDALGPGDRALIVDDLLATGGTMAASLSLIRDLGAEVVGAGFVIELAFLAARSRLDCPIKTLLSYP